MPAFIRKVAVLFAALAAVPNTSRAAMTSVEWITLMEQLELRRGNMSDHVHAQGTVRAIDQGAGSITILHPEISSADKSIWMPAMMMVFHVTRSAVLRGVKAGDAIRFEATRRKGAVMITRVTKITE